MSSSVAQHPVLWLAAAFLLGVTVEWILEFLYFRQRLFDAESRARKRAEELDSERFAHGRTQAELKGRLADLDAAQKGRTVAESLLQAARGKLSALESDLAATRAERSLTGVEMARVGRQLDSALAESREFRSAALDAALRLEGERAELASQQSATAEMRLQLAGMADELQNLNRRIPILEQELEAQTIRATALSGDLESALRRHADAEASLNEYRGALTGAQNELENLRKARADWEEQQAVAIGRLQKQESAAATARAVTAALEQKLKARADELRQLSAQLGETTEQLEALKNRNAQLQANLEAATATRASLERELAAATVPAPTPDTTELDELREELRLRVRDATSWRSKAEELEAELLGTSQAHQRLVQELERIRSGPAGGASDESLSAELEAMTRERNELAAELAVLQARPRD